MIGRAANPKSRAPAQSKFAIANALGLITTEAEPHEYIRRTQRLQYSSVPPFAQPDLLLSSTRKLAIPTSCSVPKVCACACDSRLPPPLPSPLPLAPPNPLVLVPARPHLASDLAYSHTPRYFLQNFLQSPLSRAPRVSCVPPPPCDTSWRALCSLI